jgi:hypothetical protein
VAGQAQAGTRLLAIALQRPLRSLRDGCAAWSADRTAAAAGDALHTCVLSLMGAGTGWALTTAAAAGARTPVRTASNPAVPRSLFLHTRSHPR